MNFSALNTHAIGVQLVTASAVLEGAGSFSAGASVSAQATTVNVAYANATISAAALATTQSVICFARATATLSCNAAANVEGHRVTFSNAEIVCAASSNANAVVHRQAVVYVTAQATNVAVGSRVAYASASLQAECNLTANSGVVAFGSSAIVANAAISASAILTSLVQATAHVSDSSYVVAGYTTWYDSWANASGAQYYAANSGNYHLFQAVPGLWPPTYQVFSASPSLAPISQANTGYQYRIGSMLSSGSYTTYYINGVYYQGYWKHIEVNTPYSVYTPPLTVYTGYTPNAQVVVSDVSIFRGSFAYPSGSSEVTATGTRVRIGIADVTSSASVTSTAIALGTIDASAIAIAGAETTASATSFTVHPAQATGNASANITTTPILHVYVAETVSASATATADGDILISATASVSDSSYITPGYWIPSYTTNQDFNAAFYWVHYLGSEVYFTYTPESIAPYYSNNTYTGTNIVSAIKSVLDSGAPAGTSYVSYLTSAQTRNGVSGFNGGLKRRVTTTHPAVWVAPVTVYTGYTPSANVSAEALVLLSVSLSASGEVSAAGFKTAFAEAAFTGSSITISAGTHSVVVRADAIASANLSADSFVLRGASANLDPTALVTTSVHVDSFRTASVVANANISETASKIAHAQLAGITGSSQFTESAVNFANSQGAFTGSSVTVSAAFQRAFAAIGVTSTASITAEADVEIWAKADVVASSVVAVTGTGVNSAHAYFTASSDMSALANMLVFADAALSATAKVVNGFALVAQEGTRSNGILILVEAENRTLLVDASAGNRTIIVDAEDRTIIVDAEDRTIFAEAA